MTKRKKEPQKGFTCTCGEYVAFPMYVYAHWTVPLVYACPKCKKKWDLLQGQAVEK
jgi:hypothetical protein